jgi:hypothetical protein
MQPAGRWPKIFLQVYVETTLLQLDTVISLYLASLHGIVIMNSPRDRQPSLHQKRTPLEEKSLLLQGAALGYPIHIKFIASLAFSLSDQDAKQELTLGICTTLQPLPMTSTADFLDGNRLTQTQANIPPAHLESVYAGKRKIPDVVI